MLRCVLGLVWLLFLVGTAGARCAGQDLLAVMDPAERAALQARAEAAPFPRGNLWRAKRGTASIHVLGTFHVGDPRFGGLMARLGPLIAAADRVLVEVTPEEERRLQAAMASDPAIAFITEGATLRDRLDDAEWADFAAQMRDRGVPPMLASRFRPWLAFITLSVPVCLAEADGALPSGLDDRVIAHARGSGVPVEALEGMEVLFDVFDMLTEDEALDILRATIRQAALSEHVFATLLEAYLAGEHRLAWEFSRSYVPDAVADLFPPERLEPLNARLEEALLARRNRAWLDAIVAAAEAGPVFVAVGAAHLSGHDGLLDLLERAGFALERLDG
jgi:uncharacterized protein YbaP (TraB family)